VAGEGGREGPRREGGGGGSVPAARWIRERRRRGMNPEIEVAISVRVCGRIEQVGFSNAISVSLISASGPETNICTALIVGFSPDGRLESSLTGRSTCTQLV
jgi:hypothetical protein